MRPPFLQKNDEIRIVSPSGAVAVEYIEGAKSTLQSWGLHPSEGHFAREVYGRFAGTAEQRIQDLQEAIDSPEVKAILCSRGGYGMAQIIDKIDFSPLKKQPKWLIGFSDISILHAALAHEEISAIHGMMSKHIAELAPDNEMLLQLKASLFGRLPNYSSKSPHPLNRKGKAKGILKGGNLSVLMGLRGTPFELDFHKTILFIEDIGEQAYHIDRMMQNLRLSGQLGSLSGLIVGQFTEMPEDPLMPKTVYEIIADAVKEYDFPVCFDLPSGHIDNNLPLILNEKVELKLSSKEVILNYF